MCKRIMFAMTSAYKLLQNEKFASFVEHSSYSVGKRRIFHDVIVHFSSIYSKSDEARRYHDVKTMAKWPKGIGVT